MSLKKHISWLHLIFGIVISLGLLFVLVQSKLRSFGTLPLGEKSYSVVLAQTPAQITLGLSYRTTIGADGMLFLLPTRETPTFWMLEMRFPLDIIWIDEGSVVSLSENVPAPESGAPQASIVRVGPTQPVTAVLEVPAGFIERESVKIGTPVGQVIKIHTKMW
jgi:uncharacterized membrane protein (UPF0127 family)